MSVWSRVMRRLIEVSCDLNARLRRVPQIDVAAARRRGADDRSTIWIDVRTAAERQVSTLEGAIAWDHPDLTTALPTKSQVITFCTAGFRSGSFAATLRRQGIDAVNLRGGLFAWCDSHLELVDPDGQPTQRVHIYGRSWKFIPDDYEAVW